MPKTEELHLIILLEKERDSARRRESVLFSIILHLVFVIVVVVNPKFLSFLKSEPPVQEKQQELTELVAPPPFEEPKPALPPPPVRGHLSAPPPTTPKPGGGFEAPPIVKQEPLPKPDTAQLQKPVEPPPGQQQKGGVQTEPQDQAKLNVPQGPTLEDLSSLDRKGRSDLKIPGESAGKSLEDAMRESAKNRGAGGMGSGSGLKGPQSGQRPDLSIDEPIILSDTYGVDLDPYLRRIYFIVRANWYSLIPELIYTGRKGRVTIVFDIQKNGRILNMNVVARSGTGPYDNAAVGSLNMSTPLPALPNYFPGDHITLQYTYLYNLSPRT
ncbi:MAG: TonB C-terminal domain-containing protein [Acidobacteriia bacterium]|nr:TonB C-terminal domain-containing protein [Terriglobia bacterium]